MMIEGADIGKTISRTFVLVHRNFWLNIGWVAVFLILLIVISLLLSGIILLPFTLSCVKAIINPDAAEIADIAANPVYIIFSAVAGALTLPLMPIFACILYFNGSAGEEQGQTVPLLGPENEKVKVEDLYAKPYSDDHPENPEKK